LSAASRKGIKYLFYLIVRILQITVIGGQIMPEIVFCIRYMKTVREPQRIANAIIRIFILDRGNLMREGWYAGNMRRHRLAPRVYRKAG
jgi:hypothetical protein